MGSLPSRLASRLRPCRSSQVSLGEIADFSSPQADLFQDRETPRREMRG